MNLTTYSYTNNAAVTDTTNYYFAYIPTSAYYVTISETTNGTTPFNVKNFIAIGIIDTVGQCANTQAIFQQTVPVTNTYSIQCQLQSASLSSQNLYITQAVSNIGNGVPPYNLQLNVTYTSPTALILGAAPVNDSIVYNNVPNLYTYGSGAQVNQYSFSIAIQNTYGQAFTQVSSVLVYYGICGAATGLAPTCVGSNCTYNTGFICPVAGGNNNPFFYVTNTLPVAYAYNLSPNPISTVLLNSTNGPISFANAGASNYYYFNSNISQSVAVTATSSNGNLIGAQLILYSPTCSPITTRCGDGNTCVVSTYDQTVAVPGQWYLQVVAPNSLIITTITLTLGVQNCQNITLTSSDVCQSALVGSTGNSVFQINDARYNLQQAESNAQLIINSFAVLPNTTQTCLNSLTTFACTYLFQACSTTNGFPVATLSSLCTSCQQFYGTCITAGSCVYDACKALCTGNNGGGSVSGGGGNTNGAKSTASALQSFWYDLQF